MGIETALVAAGMTAEMAADVAAVADVVGTVASVAGAGVSIANGVEQANVANQAAASQKLGMEQKNMQANQQMQMMNMGYQQQALQQDQQAQQSKDTMELEKTKMIQQQGLADKSLAMATEQQNQAQRDFNRANQKDPFSDVAVQKAKQASLLGNGSTLLNGPSGVDQNSLLIGKQTLLGA